MYANIADAKKKYAGDVMQYADSIPVKGLPSGQIMKKAKTTQYQRTTEKRELPPVEEVKCCVKNCLQEHVPKKDLQILRDDFLALPNERAKSSKV